jgi:hypothetical protein
MTTPEQWREPQPAFRRRRARDPEACKPGGSEMSWGPGLVPPGKENAPPSRGGVYRGKCPPVELARSPDLSVRATQGSPKRGDPPRGYPGDRIG